MAFHKFTYISVIFLTFIFGDNNVIFAGPHERRLLHDLVLNYSQTGDWTILERPKENDTGSMDVTLMITLQQIMDLNEKNQLIETNIWLNIAWNDYHFRWNPADYGGVQSIRINPNYIWKPDILLYNSADGNFDVAYQTNLLTYYDGTVSYIPPGLFKSSCSIDITWFPFDEQNCKLKFGSWTHDGTLLNLKLPPNTTSADTSTFYKNGEWELMGVPAQENSVFYDCCPGVPYMDITFNIRLRRRALYCVFNLVIPGITISSMALLSFSLPPDSGEKISLGVTVLLSLTVFFLLVAEKLPETSDAVSLIGIYFSCIMFMCSMSVVFTVLILNFHHRKPSTHVMSRFVRRGINEWLAWLLCMQRPGKGFSRKKLLSENSTMQVKKHSVIILGKENGIIPNQTNRSKMLKPVIFSNPNVIENKQSTINSTSTINSECNESEILLNHQAEPLNQRQYFGMIPRQFRNAEQHDIDDELPNVHNSEFHHKNYESMMYYERNNTILNRMLKEIQYLTKRAHDDDHNNEERAEWIFTAMVIDRLCMFIFVTFTVVSTAIILLSAPDLFSSSHREEAIG